MYVNTTYVAGENSNSYVLPAANGDTISSLSWSTQADLLCSTCWDGTIRVYECQKTGVQYNQVQASPKAEAVNTNNSPVLCSSWSNDGATIYVGTADNHVLAWNITSNLNGQPPPKIGIHDQPVCAINHYPRKNWVISGSYDGTVKFWNPQQPGQPLGSLNLDNAKCYAMDLQGDVLVVACSNSTIKVFNMGGDSPSHFQTFQSELKFQIRSITVLPDMSGFAVGGIEGRVSIFPFQEQKTHDNGKSQSNRFAFRCHRAIREVKKGP